MKSPQKIAGIDLGASFIKAVVMDGEYRIIEQMQTPTKDDRTSSLWMNEVKQVFNSIIHHHPQIRIIGMSAPGIPSMDNKCIQFMPGRLPGLEGHDWTAFFDHPAYILNDANAAMLTESRIGVARGYDPVILLTLGTGVGGSILIHGNLFTGYRQVGGHLGHLSINMNSPVKSITGMPGSLEDAIGDATVFQRTNGRYNSTQALIHGVKSGDDQANQFWLESVRALAVGLAALGNVLSPQLVVLGGGITAAGNILLDPLSIFLDEYEWRPGGKQFEIKLATSGAYAGAIGAGIFAAEKTIA